MSTIDLLQASNKPRLFIIMGVAGCGKSTIGDGLADQLGAIYKDGDDFHPQSNIDKMSDGISLTDEDRWPWLKIVAQDMAKLEGQVFMGCSALKRCYRDYITEQAGEPVLFIHLAGSKALILGRMAARVGHFMPTALLDSQFATLEVPSADELAISVDISPDTAAIIENIKTRIG
jgi:gluconokinase